MKNQFSAQGKQYFVASNGALKRVKGSKRKRASLRAARMMPGDVLDFQTRANDEYWTVVNQHGEKIGQMLKVFEGRKRDPKEFISMKGVTIGKVDGKPYRASKRASKRASLRAASDVDKMIDFYEKANRLGNMVMNQVIEVLEGEGEDSNPNAIKMALREFSRFPEVRKILEEWMDEFGGAY